MKRPFFKIRSGTTLIELMLFAAILAIVMTAILPILFTATENRLFQQTASIVEQNGIQLLQNASFRIRNAERILDPAPNSTGSVLTLQSSSGATDPIIIGVTSGSLVIIQNRTREVLSSPQVAIQEFVVRNTSTSTSRQSVLITFRVSRTIRLQAPHSYSKTFRALFTLLPADVPKGGTHGCADPTCVSSGSYTWDVWDSTQGCLTAVTALDCRNY